MALLLAAVLLQGLLVKVEMVTAVMAVAVVAAIMVELEVNRKLVEVDLATYLRVLSLMRTGPVMDSV